MCPKRQPALKEFKRNENSGGVMGMSNDVISETKQPKADAMLAEEDVQTALALVAAGTPFMVHSAGPNKWRSVACLRRPRNSTSFPGMRE